jgi:hypothetical protein
LINFSLLFVTCTFVEHCLGLDCNLKSQQIEVANLLWFQITKLNQNRAHINHGSQNLGRNPFVQIDNASCSYLVNVQQLIK